MNNHSFYQYLQQIRELYGNELLLELPERKATQSLEEFHWEISECQKCPLGEMRNNLVFGVGNPKSPVVFVGEAPGRDEDLHGEPFVGRSGKLLDKIYSAINLSRSEIYICNVLKCRPPQNRDPLDLEIELCEQHLIRQLEIINPGLIVALGRIAAHTLLHIKGKMADMRKKMFIYHGIPVKVTYHPAALLRNPNLKRAAWEDFQEIRILYDAIISERKNHG